MRVKLMTFRYSATLGGFDDTPLLDFARDKEVIAFRENFYVVNEVPHVTCVITYQDAIVPQSALDAAREIAARPPQPAPHQAGGFAPRFQRRDGAPDPCEGLSETERALFNHMREWRSHTAHAEGLPPYLILTNRQLVAIVRKRPESPTALGHIDGVGPGKLARYGAAILERLNGAPPRSAPPAASGTVAPAGDVAPADPAPAAELAAVAAPGDVAPRDVSSAVPEAISPAAPAALSTSAPAALSTAVPAANSSTTPAALSTTAPAAVSSTTPEAVSTAAPKAVSSAAPAAASSVTAAPKVISTAARRAVSSAAPAAASSVTAAPKVISTAARRAVSSAAPAALSTAAPAAVSSAAPEAAS